MKAANGKVWRRSGASPSSAHRSTAAFIAAWKTAQSGLLAAHPNLFHSVLETVPAAGWQVVHEDDGLLIAFVGLRDASVCDRLAQSIGELLESGGAVAPPILVRAVEQLERGRLARRRSFFLAT